MNRTPQLICFRSLLAVLTATAFAMSSLPAHATIRLTEVMSSSGTGGTADWFEATNYGSTSVDVTGWRMDDNSFAFANSVPLTGITSIAPGESALFFELNTTMGQPDAATQTANFRTFWGGSAATAAIGYYSGSSVSLSSAGDGVVLFTPSPDGGVTPGTEATPRVSFGAATTGSSFYYTYNATGAPSTSPNTSAIVSTVGLLDGQNSFLSATASPQNIGSPGTAAVVPEPATLSLGGIAVALGAFALRRRGRPS